MYSKEEKKQLIIDFWKSFGCYVQSHRVCRQIGDPGLFRKTGIKGVELKFDLSPHRVMVTVEINLRNEDKRLKLYERLSQYRVILQQNLPEELIWDPLYLRESGQLVCRIYSCLNEISFHNRANWPVIFEFMVTYGTVLHQNVLELRDLLVE